MIRCLIVAVCGLFYLNTAISQNVIEEKNEANIKEPKVETLIWGVQTGFLGVWGYNELHLIERFALRSEFGFEMGFGFGGGSYNRYDYFNASPSVTAEPRWYYFLNPEPFLSKNSGSFLALKVSIIPPFGYIGVSSEGRDLLTNEKYNYTGYQFVISNMMFRFIPKWGIRKTWWKHFTLEFAHSSPPTIKIEKQMLKNQTRFLLLVLLFLGSTFGKPLFAQMYNPLSPDYKEAIETQQRLRGYIFFVPVIAILLIFSPFPIIDMDEVPKKLTLRLKSDAGVAGSSAQMTPLAYELASDIMTLENSFAGLINIDTELGIDERHYFGLGFGFLFDRYFSFDLSYKYAFAHKIPIFNNTGYFNLLGGGFVGYGFSLLAGNSQSGSVKQQDLTERSFAVIKDHLHTVRMGIGLEAMFNIKKGCSIYLALKGMFAPYSIRNAEIEMADTKEIIPIRKANGFMAQWYIGLGLAFDLVLRR
ncbi:hypothetical protein CHS0354_000734 [Potamilus streckersoni]|uniref:Outer membrane protein beta-barrel domain-containing protein n=1 Tax=Potamilus streckersoni TaxID=2493646 RepID=A0AAE0W7K6_9BIVA|nr:hypothetical protein CHS0354_000734 [Potamilus streckersoni]